MFLEAYSYKANIHLGRTSYIILHGALKLQDGLRIPALFSVLFLSWQTPGSELETCLKKQVTDILGTYEKRTDERYSLAHRVF